jgi:apolipoprotein N-acyltransferase
MEYALHLALPLGTFFNLAYSQYTNLSLLQVMSVAGLWAISFLVTWFASVANYAWEGGFDVQRVGRGVLAAVCAWCCCAPQGRRCRWRCSQPT